METSLFATIPPELRIQIYELVLYHPPRGPIRITFDGSRRACANDSALAITRVCRQVRNESLPVYFSINTFRLATSVRYGGWGNVSTCAGRIRAWTMRAGNVGAWMKDVIIDFDDSLPVRNKTALRGLYGLIKECRWVFTARGARLRFVVEVEVAICDETFDLDVNDLVAYREAVHGKLTRITLFMQRLFSTYSPSLQWSQDMIAEVEEGLMQFADWLQEDRKVEELKAEGPGLLKSRDDEGRA